MRHDPETQARISETRRRNAASLTIEQRREMCNAPSLHSLIATATKAQLVRALRTSHEHVAACTRLGTSPERPEAVFRDALACAMADSRTDLDAEEQPYDYEARNYGARYRDETG